MNVLSLFDGMSCAQIALERAKIPVENYFASEVDKYAIKIAQKNYPDTIQLGDIRNLKSENLPKIDLLIGGSPCQGFSSAGKGLNFDDPRSKLFFEFVRILKEVKPKYFLLENVRMKNEWRDIISEFIGCDPIEINSALVSGQSRRRFYWTNIPGISQPEDKNIFLRDILIDGVTDLEKGRTLRGSTRNPTPKDYFLYRGHQVVLLSERELEYMRREVKDGRDHYDFGHHSDVAKNKSSAIVANLAKGVPYNVLWDGRVWRKLHPVECERLQTLPDDYTEGVSNTQRYKMIGNGFTVDVIAHILRCLKESGL